MRFDPALLRHAIGNRAPRWPFVANASSVFYDRNLHYFGTGLLPGVLRDLGPKSLVGTLSGVAWAAHPFGAKAARFDGSAFADVLDVPQFGTGTQIIRFRPLSLPAATDRDVLTTYYEQDVVEPFLTHDKQFFLTPAGAAKFRIFDGAAKLVASTSAVAVGGTYTVGVTIDATNMRLYFEGAEEGSTPAGAAFTGYTNPALRFCGLPTSLNDGETTITRADAQILDMLTTPDIWSAAQMKAYADPATRWDLYQERRVPRAWPAAAVGGATDDYDLGAPRPRFARRGRVWVPGWIAPPDPHPVVATEGAPGLPAMWRPQAPKIARYVGPRLRLEHDRAEVAAAGQDAHVAGALKSIAPKSKLWLPAWVRLREVVTDEVGVVVATVQRWRKIGLRLFKGL